MCGDGTHLVRHGAHLELRGAGPSGGARLGGLEGAGGVDAEGKEEEDCAEHRGVVWCGADRPSGNC